MRNLAIAAAMLLTACAATPIEAIVTGANPPGWKVGSQQDLGPGRGTIREFIPDGEFIDAWQHLSTIQFLKGEKRSPRVAMGILEQMMKTRCGERAEWKVLQEDSNSVLYEWRISNCVGQSNQTEISRLIQGNDGLHRIAYTEKGYQMNSENREYWLKVLQDAYVTKGTPNNPNTPKSN